MKSSGSSSPAGRAGRKTTLLHSCPICSSLEERFVDPIAEIATERLVEKNETVAHEGDPSSGFYLIVSGKLRVFKSSASGKESVLYFAETGMTFGEDSLFGPGKFLETAVAVDRTKLLHVPRVEFLNMIRKNPELAFQVMESLCGWIRRLSASVENIALLGARDKVVRHLLALASKSGKPNAIELSTKKKEIAEKLGIAPETFSRVLRELEKRRLIESEGKVIRILDAARLAEEVPE